jgi:DNA-directed RNA polymerase specialized sigma24 family protein
MNKIAEKYARSFSQSNNIEYDDLLQEAELACWNAEYDGSYDPRKAALTSYQTTCVFRHLCSVTDSIKRKRLPGYQVEMSDLLPDKSPNPEDTAVFYELVRQLPDDARVVTDLVFSNDFLAGLDPTKSKNIIREVLGWSNDRINSAFNAITGMLRLRNA